MGVQLDVSVFGNNQIWIGTLNNLIKKIETLK